MSLSAPVQTLIDQFVGVGQRSGKHALVTESRLVCLFEPQVYNLSTPGIETLRFSDSEYATDSTHTPASTIWLPRFVMPSVRSSLGFDGGSVGHAGTITLGSAILLNHDGRLDDYLDYASYNWQGQQAQILLGGHDWDRDDFDVLIDCKIVAVSANLEEVRVDLEGVLPLEQSFSSVLYGGRGGALDFDGSTTEVLVGDEYDFGYRSFTIEAWFTTTDLAVDRIIAQKRASWSTAGDAGWTFGMNSSDQLRFLISDGTTGASLNVGASGALDDGAWHHAAVAVDRDTDEMQAYVDGQPYGSAVDISSVTGYIADRAVDMTIGVNSGGTTQHWDGMLDEIRIWGTARTAEQIEASYLQSAVGTEEGLVGAFGFDEYGLIDSGATALNTVGGPNVISAVFDASGDRIDWGNNKDVTTGSFSFGIWFRAGDGDTGDSFLFGKRNSVRGLSDAGYNLSIESGFLYARVSDGDGVSQATLSPFGIAFRDDWWYAAVVSVDTAADVMRLSWRPFGFDWVDETELDISTFLTGSVTNAVNLRAGADGAAGNQFLGQVANAFFCPAALTLSQMHRVMDYAWFPADADPTAPAEVDDASGVSGTGYWAIDENTGTTITDAVGSTDGTATAGVTWQDRDADVTIGSGEWVSSKDGPRELAGLPKPICLGRVKDVPGVTVEAISERLVQFNTPEFGESNAVEAVRVDGLEMTLGASPAGDYTVDLVESLLTVDSAIGDGAITVDAKGLEDGTGTWLYRTGDITAWVVEDQIGATLEPSGYTFFGSGGATYGAQAGLNAAYPYEIGLYLRSEEYKVKEVMAALFQAGSEAEGERGRLFWAQLFGGNIRAGALRDLTGETPDHVIGEEHIEDSPDGIKLEGMRPPVWKVLVGWERVWHDFRDFLGGVAEDEQARMEQEYRWAEWSDSSVKTAYPDARVLKLPTLIYRDADAKLEAQVLFNLLSVPRPVYTVKLVREMFQVEIGDVVQVTDDRLALDAGKLFMCIGYNYDLGSQSSYPTATVELWGGF